MVVGELSCPNDHRIFIVAIFLDDFEQFTLQFRKRQTRRTWLNFGLTLFFFMLRILCRLRSAAVCSVGAGLCSRGAAPDIFPVKCSAWY